MEGAGAEAGPRTGPEIGYGPPGDDPGVARAASIRSLGHATRVFLSFGSPRVLLGGLTLVTGVRLGVAAAGQAPIGVADVAAIGVVVALVPFVEWFVHRAILHFEPRRVRGRPVDPGVGHREHHDNPASINWVLLTTVHAAVFQAANAVVAAAVVGIPAALLRWSPTGPALTAVVAALAALAHYEWSHFLFHTAYRPRTARYRRLKANHLRHHWRDERAWLGITSNLADRALGTLPR